MRRVPVICALLLAACSLVTGLDGLSEGGDAASSGGADQPEASAPDGSNDTPDARDAATDTEIHRDADALAPCGFPGPTQGLIAYYPFEEGTGSVVHDCGNNHVDGKFVRQGAAGNWAPGRKGGAIRVQPPNGCVDLGVPSTLQPPTLTASLWIQITKFPVAGASGYLIGQSMNADHDGWRIATATENDAGVVTWEHAVLGSKHIHGVVVPTIGTWRHVAMTFAPNDKLEIYLDGSRVLSQSGLPSIDFSAVSMRIGCRADDANYFDGLIDELRIYDRVLTLAEIATLAK